MGKIKSMSLPETSFIKDELQTTMATVKKINKYHRRTMELLKKEVEIIRTGMLNTPSL